MQILIYKHVHLQKPEIAKAGLTQAQISIISLKINEQPSHMILWDHRTHFIIILALFRRNVKI